ncbi:MAG: hypothetical protein V3S01_13155, partial [Dehalococcoidia bacterium]
PPAAGSAASWRDGASMRYLILGLAVAVAAILTLVFLEPFGGSDGVEDTGSPGTNICDRPLPALGSGQITKEQFDTVDAGMDLVISLAAEGDVSRAQEAFFSVVHDFTHDVDGPLRDSNDDLAKRLCKAVAQIETEFAFGGEAATIAEESESIRDLLRQAAAEMGFDE